MEPNGEMMRLPPPPLLAPAACANDEMIRLRVENAMMMSQLRLERQQNAQLRHENTHVLKELMQTQRTKGGSVDKLKQELATTKKELARAKAKLPRSLRERRLLRDYRLYLATNPPDDMLAMCATALRGNLKPGMFIYDLVLAQLQFFASSSSAFPGRACTTFPPKVVHWCESMYMAFGRQAYELLSGEAKASSIGDKRNPSTWSGHMVLPSLRMIQRRLAAFRSQNGLSSVVGAPNYVRNKDLLKRMAPPSDDALPPTTQEHLAWIAALIESYQHVPVHTEAMHKDLDDAIEFLSSLQVNDPTLLDLVQRRQRHDHEAWSSSCAEVLRLTEAATATLR